MPSNMDLKEEAATLGAELGVAVETEGLTNAQLSKLVEGLYEQLEAREKPSSDPPPAAEPPPPSPPPAATKPATSFAYFVQGRGSIVSMSRIFAPGSEIKLSDFAGTPEQAAKSLAAHVAAGRVVKRGTP